MRRIIILVVISLALMGFSDGKVAAEQKLDIPSTRLVFAATITASGFYAFHTAIGEVISRHPKIECVVESVGGAGKTMAAIARKKCQLGMITMEAFHRAHYGNMDFKGNPMAKDMRLNWLTMMLPQNFIVLNSIKSWKDLNGKPVGILPGTGGRLAEWLMDGNGVRPSSKETISATDIAIERLKRGDIVAYLGKGGKKDAMVMRILTEVANSTLLPVSKSMLDKASKKYPGQFISATMPAGTYPKQPNALPTNGYAIGNASHKDLSADVIYEIARITFKNRKYLASTYKTSIGYFDRWPELSLQGNSGVPFHAGIVKFLQEKGLKVPKHLIPPEIK